MKRRLLKLALLLLIGAIINVAVAWGCVYFFDESSDGIQIGFPSSEDAWLASNGWDVSSFTTETPEMIANPIVPKHWSADPKTGKADLQVKPYGWLDQWSVLFAGHEFRRFDWTARTQQYPFLPVAGQFRAGWPFDALYGDAHVDAEGPDAYSVAMKARKLSYTFRYAWVPAKQMKYPPEIRGALPWLPTWPGFAINTIFYAGAVWLLLLFAPFKLRRWRRIKRGLCAKCAYDLRGGRGGAHAACPECGAPIAHLAK